MSARCRLGLADGYGASPHGCVQRSLLALGGQHQVRDVLPIHHAGVAGGSPPPGSLGGGWQRLPLLIVGTGEARAGRRPVSVVCVRGDATDADTDTRPMYGCVLTITTHQRYVGSDTDSIMLTRTVQSWDLPTDVDMEDAWYDLLRNAVHGDSKEVHLDICIIKLNIDH